MTKRALDIVVSALGLLALAPVLTGLAVAVRVRSGTPVLHVATRVGRYGRPFHLYKFRTMKPGAATSGPPITAMGDQRITDIGRVLRKTKLDELPQLANVLLGNMSLVGPRPEDPRFVASYNREQLRVLDVRPGITSLASLRFRNEEELLAGPDWEATYRNEIMPTKLAAELDYLDHAGPADDLRVIIDTALTLMHRHKAEPEESS